MPNPFSSTKPDALVSAADQCLNESANTFWRLPVHVINNELFVVRKVFSSIYENATNGDDFDPEMFAKLLSQLSKIKKEAKQFKVGDEVPVSYSYKDKK